MPSSSKKIATGIGAAAIAAVALVVGLPEQKTHDFLEFQQLLELYNHEIKANGPITIIRSPDDTADDVIDKINTEILERPVTKSAKLDGKSFTTVEYDAYRTDLISKFTELPAEK